MKCGYFFGLGFVCYPSTSRDLVEAYLDTTFFLLQLFIRMITFNQWQSDPFTVFILGACLHIFAIILFINALCTLWTRRSPWAATLLRSVKSSVASGVRYTSQSIQQLRTDAVETCPTLRATLRSREVKLMATLIVATVIFSLTATHYMDLGYRGFAYFWWISAAMAITCCRYLGMVLLVRTWGFPLLARWCTRVWNRRNASELPADVAPAFERPATDIRNATQDDAPAEAEVEQEHPVNIKEEEDSQSAIDMAQLPTLDAPTPTEDSNATAPVGTRTRLARSRATAVAKSPEVATAPTETTTRYEMRERKAKIDPPPPSTPAAKPTKKAAAKKAPAKKTPAKTTKNNTKASGSKAQKQPPKKQPAKGKAGRR